MQRTCLVRVGAFGHVGPFTALDVRSYQRGMRVICRTRRGLEIGEVLGPAPSIHDADPATDGEIVRGMTAEDELLVLRLEDRRQAAIAACEARLAAEQPEATLVDVEQTFDGQSLFFYFLGEVTPAVESITAELAETYEQTVQMKQFARLLEEGCGPDCGTDQAGACGTSEGCASCAIACAVRA